VFWGELKLWHPQLSLLSFVDFVFSLPAIFPAKDPLAIFLLLSKYLPK